MTTDDRFIWHYRAQTAGFVAILVVFVALGAFWLGQQTALIRELTPALDETLASAQLLTAALDTLDAAVGDACRVVGP
jgi:hypothetical protein